MRAQAPSGRCFAVALTAHEVPVEANGFGPATQPFYAGFLRRGEEGHGGRTTLGTSLAIALAHVPSATPATRGVSVGRRASSARRG